MEQMKQNNKPKLELIINDQPISLNHFAATLIKNVVLSIVTSLRLDSAPEKIEIHLKP